MGGTLLAYGVIQFPLYGPPAVRSPSPPDYFPRQVRGFFLVLGVVFRDIGHEFATHILTDSNAVVHGGRSFHVLRHRVLDCFASNSGTGVLLAELTHLAEQLFHRRRIRAM